jgi:hypothetical protein
VSIKQQTTALFLSTIVTRTRRHTELTKKKKTDRSSGKPVLCQRTFSSLIKKKIQFFVQFVYTVKLHSLLRVWGPLYVVQFLCVNNSAHNCTYSTRIFKYTYEITAVNSPYKILATVPSTVYRTPVCRIKT